MSGAFGGLAFGEGAFGGPAEIWPRTIISQYGNSPTLGLLIEAANQWLNPSANINNFYDLVWNVATAQGYGLDVWGRIVGVQRYLQVSLLKYWGYDEAGTTSADPYGQSPFYSGAPISSNYALTDDAFRLLILAKAAANITDGSIPSINAILMALFPGRGNAWVADGLNMTLAYTFDFDPALTPVELAIIAQSGVLPRSTGCSTSVVQL
jgi:hypothetical protein